MKKRRLKKEVIAKLIIFICFLGVIYSSYKIIYWKESVKENKIIKEDINKNVIVTPKEESDNPDDIEYKIDFLKLKEENKDTVAYLKVNNTNIDYIVVKAKDNEYYLNHNFRKKYNIAGWIFADYHNNFDGNDKNIVIFGHNTQDGSMFGSLKDVLESNWQDNEDNLIITFITEKESYIYQVFSTYVIEPEDYYISTEFESDEEYITFLNTIKKRSNKDYNIDLNENDKILTLSGCTDKGAKRVVLHAKLL